MYREVSPNMNPKPVFVMFGDLQAGADLHEWHEVAAATPEKCLATPATTPGLDKLTRKHMNDGRKIWDKQQVKNRFYACKIK